MRAPFQILVIPFRRTAVGLEFAVLRRRDAGWWQFVAGGGEDDESPALAAARETEEEIGLAASGRLLRLDSMATIPKSAFPTAAVAWGENIDVIPEYAFAIDAGETTLVLSGEHTEARWVSYEQARGLLRWDSNRNALWELKQSLEKGSAQAPTLGTQQRG